MTKTESVALISRRRLSEDLLRSRSGKFRLRNVFVSHVLAVSNVIKTLRPILFHAFYLRDVFRSLAGGRSRSFFTEHFTLYSAFWKTKFRSCHRAASNICRGAPKNYESSGFRRRSACPTSSRASVPPSVITPRTAALDARVEPVHDKTESAALIFGRSHFLPGELWGGQPPIRIRTRCVDSVCEAIGPWRRRPTTPTTIYFKVAEIGPNPWEWTQPQPGRRAPVSAIS